VIVRSLIIGAAAALAALSVRACFRSPLVAGQGVTLTFQDADQRHLAVGIQQDVEGSFVGEEWRPGRWLNGDDTLEGRRVHLPSDTFSIQKVTLFKFR
jgi:hypothetical protein